MRSIQYISNRVNCEERLQVLGDAVLSLAKISDKFLRRANAEEVPDEAALRLINYLLSFESFQELESYWFYYYDPKNLGEWEIILDHVYRRSITAKHLMN
ncbi:hypothetical protein APR41_02140 [Salegentibacter salinarum]|uniref:Uncharacterized protein n=1 Tax=Salegentibacter salinarum TaxID=447422 RepID=A0A2N0U447_9FLAO|nr:hypothetical protein [Salegentibacter salinarum]PKD21801.1 hypothetical protein APR41_02140 [Salegentibacter salinarum]SKB33454.1 hypothetical protein SAMN05660903_00131 [Salegentibacter salinarum]